MKHLATLAHRCHPATSAMSTALRCAPIHGAPARNPQRGIALVFVLLMLAVAMGLALITARMTLMGDKASRNDRDRQIAFQAAELALNDAELDIMDPEINHAADKTKSNATSVNKARGCSFGNPDEGLAPGAGCSATTAARGLCGLDPSKALTTPPTPLYQYTNWEETDDSKRTYVNFGEYTGRSADLVVGDGTTPAKKPKYIIFQTTNTNIAAGNAVVPIKYAYKVYALGYGANEKTQVMLEGEFYKPMLDKFCSK